MKTISVVRQDHVFRTLARFMGIGIVTTPLDERQAKGERVYWGVWIKGTSEAFQGKYFNPLNDTDLAIDILLYFGMSLNGNFSVSAGEVQTKTHTLGVIHEGKLICGSTFTVNHVSEVKQTMRHLIVEAAYKILTGEEL